MNKKLRNRKFSPDKMPYINLNYESYLEKNNNNNFLYDR